MEADVSQRPVDPPPPSSLSPPMSLCSVYSGHQSILIPPAELETNPALWLLAVSQYKVRDTFCSYSVMELCTKGLGSQTESLKVSNARVPGALPASWGNTVLEGVEEVWWGSHCHLRIYRVASTFPILTQSVVPCPVLTVAS